MAGIPNTGTDKAQRPKSVGSIKTHPGNVCARAQQIPTVAALQERLTRSGFEGNNHFSKWCYDHSVCSGFQTCGIVTDEIERFGRLKSPARRTSSGVGPFLR